jgi:hypothetical protein
VEANPFAPDEIVVRSPTYKSAKGPLVRVYVDESSINEGRFRGYGGIWVPDSAEKALRDSVAAVRSLHGMQPATGEFKWNKVSTNKLGAYCDLVDAFFGCGGVRFNSIIVDRHNPGPKRGGAEDDHYTEIHWLLRRRMVADVRYVICLDERNNRAPDRHANLQSVLNNCGRRELGYDGCVREVGARCSKSESLIQLADVLLGAVCYHFNGKHSLANASAAKCELARDIARRGHFPRGLIHSTASSASKFNVWLFKPSIGTR